MDWLRELQLIISGFVPGVVVGIAALTLYRWALSRRLRRSKPSFRKRAEPRRVPDEHANVTADSVAEEARPAARQTQARYFPRTRNWTNKTKS